MGTEKKTPRHGDRVTWSGYARSGELMVLEGNVCFVDEENRTFGVVWEQIPQHNGKVLPLYAGSVPFSIFDECSDGQEWTLADGADVPREVGE